MKVQALHPNFKMPTRATDLSGGYDIYMPEDGEVYEGQILKFPLGFATEIPPGHVALVLPRSSTGGDGVEMANTAGVIDADYRGQWFAKLTLKRNMLRERAHLAWAAGDRVLQFVIVPVATPELIQVESVAKTERGAGGFGSTGA